ncbi:methylated-DNA--[protein]-cysteine S-methyltransferase [Balneatrix alpica]|uniref:Methylated-DNA--protein-cysteine methyltransferase n=1 Tax=Balneatrix alpica TaxID=75684 RepID=A0ABV5ZC53_9GAMM|nr:methylated-DNA--[protein]-cysteine S-methyltransferase [Balneatrix alpica]
MIVYRWFATPLGGMLALANPQGLQGLYFEGQQYFPALDNHWQEQPLPLFQELEQQLQAYFAGQLRQFDLPLAPQGTAFQQQVWQAIATIPYGHSRRYGELAHALNKPTASRAVGAATGRNPLSLIVPCHRVLGSQGKLTGYAGGLERKRALLQLEGLL